VFGSGKLPERPRTAEDKHRQRRKPRGAERGFPVLATNVTQRVYRGRMEAVGSFGISI